MELDPPPLLCQVSSYCSNGGGRRGRQTHAMIADEDWTGGDCGGGGADEVASQGDVSSCRWWGGVGGLGRIPGVDGIGLRVPWCANVVRDLEVVGCVLSVC